MNIPPVSTRPLPKLVWAAVAAAGAVAVWAPFAAVRRGAPVRLWAALAPVARARPAPVGTARTWHALSERDSKGSREGH